MAADVAEECVAGPAADEHDGEDGDAGQVHGHGGPGPDGVCADLGPGEAQGARTEVGGAVAQELDHVLARREVGAARKADCLDRGVEGGPGEGQDSGGECCPCADGAEDGVARSRHDHGILLAIVLLHGESERDVVGLRQGRVRVPEVAAGADELEVPEAEAARAPRGAGDREVLAGPEGEEKCPAGPLGEG